MPDNSEKARLKHFQKVNIAYLVYGWCDTALAFVPQEKKKPIVSKGKRKELRDIVIAFLNREGFVRCELPELYSVPRVAVREAERLLDEWKPPRMMGEEIRRYFLHQLTLLAMGFVPKSLDLKELESFTTE